MNNSSLIFNFFAKIFLYSIVIEIKNNFCKMNMPGIKNATYKELSFLLQCII